MTEAENIDRIIAALRRVEKKNLLIIELANNIPIKHGMLDIDVLATMQREVNLAIAEAKAYGAGTIMAVDALVRLRGIEE